MRRGRGNYILEPSGSLRRLRIIIFVGNAFRERCRVESSRFPITNAKKNFPSFSVFQSVVSIAPDILFRFCFLFLVFFFGLVFFFFFPHQPNRFLLPLPNAKRFSVVNHVSCFCSSIQVFQNCFHLTIRKKKRKKNY